MAEAHANILIDLVRKQCLIRGFEGIKGLGLAFRNLDIDLSKKIVYEELKHGLKNYGINMSEENLFTLFEAFDKDGSGEIDFHEFLNVLSPPMNERRKRIVNMAFNSLDTNKDGVLKAEEDITHVRCKEQILSHTNFLTGLWSEEQAFKHFLKGFDDPKCPDGIITREEFMEFYAGVSATVGDDGYFELNMSNIYQIGVPR